MDRVLSWVGKSVTALGMAMFIVGLVWFAHFSFSLKAYVSSVLTMVVGVLLGVTGSARWGYILFRVRQYFRRD